MDRDNLIEIRVMNKDAVLPRGKRKMLVFEDIHLIPSTISEDEEGYTLSFNTEGLNNLELLLKERETVKLRFLINCGKLSELYKKYDFSLCLENLYYDINLIPKVLDRNYQQLSETSLLNQYKALIAAVLAPRYTFKDYYEGGSDLYEKNKKLKYYLEENSIDCIMEKLLEAYNEGIKVEQKKKVLVRKSEIIGYRIEMPILIIITIAALSLCAYLFFVEKTYDDSVIDAYEAYMTDDYFKVQNVLISTDVERLDTYSKFVLAKSYVISESLTNKQKENVLSNLSIKTEEAVLKYWIYIGRLEFDSAIEQAQRLGDQDLLMYGYIKYKAYISDNMDMNGQEKAELIKSLESQIESLKKQMNSEREQFTR